MIPESTRFSRPRCLAWPLGSRSCNVYAGASDTVILSAMSVPPAGSITGKVDAQLSCSWGWGPADPATDDPLFKKFAAQGQSFFTAAGDSGAYGASSQYVYPADDANVTVVGGTDLATAGPGGAWSGETAWADGGGGYYAPDNIPIPSWQSAAIAAFNGRSGRTGSTSLRNSPDVAAEANFDFYVCADQAACTSNRTAARVLRRRCGPVTLRSSTGRSSRGSGAGGIHQRRAVCARQRIRRRRRPGDARRRRRQQRLPGRAGPRSRDRLGKSEWIRLDQCPGPIVLSGIHRETGGAVSVAAGAAGKALLTSAVTGGFDSAIALTAGGQPNGVTVSFSPASLTGAGSSTVTFQVAATVPADPPDHADRHERGRGNLDSAVVHHRRAHGDRPELHAELEFFHFHRRGLGRHRGISSVSSGGFASAIALSASGQPSGVTVGFSPSSLTGSGTSTMSVQAASSVATGTYPITVTGSSGARAQHDGEPDRDRAAELCPGGKHGESVPAAGSERHVHAVDNGRGRIAGPAGRLRSARPGLQSARGRCRQRERAARSRQQGQTPRACRQGKARRRGHGQVHRRAAHERAAAAVTVIGYVPVATLDAA